MQINGIEFKLIDSEVSDYECDGCYFEGDRTCSHLRDWDCGNQIFKKTEQAEQAELIHGGGLEIIRHWDGHPNYARDTGGVLFIFKRVQKYSKQNERYVREIKQLENLASFLLDSLNRG